MWYIYQSVQLCPPLANPWTAAHQASLSITNSRACSNSCSSNWWCHPTISSSLVPVSSCLHSVPASGSFPMSQFFTSGGQSIYIYCIYNIYTYTCCIYMYTIEYYSAIKNNEILPFPATWMDLEIIALSAVSQTKTDIILYHLHVKYKTKKWYKHIYWQNGNRLTDI